MIDLVRIHNSIVFTSYEKIYSCQDSHLPRIFLLSRLWFFMALLHANHAAPAPYAAPNEWPSIAQLLSSLSILLLARAENCQFRSERLLRAP